MTKTNVTFLLDRTGSMEPIRDDTIGAFNTYLDELQNGEGSESIRFSLIQFDSWSLDKTCIDVVPKDAKRLDRSSYVPRASTPLIDAAYKTIKAVERSVATHKDDKVVICIQTDGQENSSTEHTWDELNDLIKDKTKDGWQFNFLGCGIDAYVQGAKMGIAQMSTMSYDRNDPQATRSAYNSMAQSTRLYAAGATMDTSLSNEQRAEAKDAFVPKATPDEGTVLKPKPKSQIVDDINL